jgi:hypothetical protein
MLSTKERIDMSVAYVAPDAQDYGSLPTRTMSEKTADEKEYEWALFNVFVPCKIPAKKVEVAYTIEPDPYLAAFKFPTADPWLIGT